MFDVAKLLADAALLGWSDGELARQAEVSGATIWRLRRGSARRSTLAKLAAAVGHPLSRYLLAEVA